MLNAQKLTRGLRATQVKTKTGTSCVQAESFLDLICPWRKGFYRVWGVSRPRTYRTYPMQIGPRMVLERGIIAFRVVRTVVGTATLQALLCAFQDKSGNGEKVGSLHLFKRWRCVDLLQFQVGSYAPDIEGADRARLRRIRYR